MKEGIFAPPKDIVKAMGLVFGDIGTSPIYTLAIIFTLIPASVKNITGVLSLIIWTLVLLVTVQYAWLAMSLSTKGEGGIIVLKEILINKLTSVRKIVFAGFLGFIGVSLLMGDGVITPAISILSAVEGIELVPGIKDIESEIVILITCIITILLFSLQYKGTDKVSMYFGPIMIIWFTALLLTGLISISKNPEVLKAVSPYHGFNFLTDNGFTGFFILSEIILCATGGEALYADMGHLGRKPIRSAWFFVFFALAINYLGQGAFLITHQQEGFILFELVKSFSQILYIPFLVLTLLATIIASQAMISAVMSLIYQGITTRIFPLMKVKYTSSKIKSQIYIGAVNWVLMIMVLLIIILFGESKNLAASYGLAVTATMTISMVLMIWIFKLRKSYIKLAASILVFFANLIFLIAVSDKIPHGGYWSLIIAAIPFLIIQLWVYGNDRMRMNFRPMAVDVFLESYNQIYNSVNKIKGTAIFFTKSLEIVPPYIAHVIIRGNIVYEKNIMVSVHKSEGPFNISLNRKDNMGPGLIGFEIKAGYMERIDLDKIFKELNLSEKVIFYGSEEIVTSNPLLKIFNIIKKITPSFVRFYNLPYNKLHGVITRLEI